MASLAKYWRRFSLPSTVTAFVQRLCLIDRWTAAIVDRRYSRLSSREALGTRPGVGLGGSGMHGEGVDPTRISIKMNGAAREVYQFDLNGTVQPGTCSISGHHARIPPVEMSAPCRRVYSAINRGRMKRRTNAVGRSGGAPLLMPMNAGSCSGLAHEA